jgi:hypothetical protein
MAAMKIELIFGLDRALLEDKSAPPRETLLIALASPLSGAAEILAVLRVRIERCILEAPVLNMTLRVTEENAALVFRSERYFLELGRLRLTIPRFAEPGAMEIIHRDEGGGQFSFRLTLSHTLLGRLLHQLAYFRDS